jgi:hypothetical protein
VDISRSRDLWGLLSLRYCNGDGDGANALNATTSWGIGSGAGGARNAAVMASLMCAVIFDLGIPLRRLHREQDAYRQRVVSRMAEKIRMCDDANFEMSVRAPHFLRRSPLLSTPDHNFKSSAMTPRPTITHSASPTRLSRSSKRTLCDKRPTFDATETPIAL